jgi:inosine/xanthosine triphosphate pyrophosphatase family protein
MRKLILATTNPNKVDKLRWIMGEYFDNITPQSQKIDVEETEDNFEGNYHGYPS